MDCGDSAPPMVARRVHSTAGGEDGDGFLEQVDWSLGRE